MSIRLDRVKLIAEMARQDMRVKERGKKAGGSSCTITAIRGGKSCREMNDLFDNLFACQHPNYTADGKIIIHILKNEDVTQWFK